MLVPSMMLQPLIENCVKHGLSSKVEGGTIRLQTRLIEGRLQLMHLDPARVRTATRIVCRHAAIAADEVGGGQVDVLLAAVSGGGCELRVTDPGHPLPAELRARAFEPFTPTRARGTGLGLPIVLRIAREHGGTAELRDGVSGGNVVTITFPGS